MFLSNPAEKLCVLVSIDFGVFSKIDLHSRLLFPSKVRTIFASFGARPAPFCVFSAQVYHIHTDG